jgi:FMN phosphatase YigB (HAD superfamily)
MKKKIIFFDGDGTLWYPKKTKHKEAPHWVYKLKGDGKFHNSQLIMTPTAVSTIKKLKKLGIITVILSTHPHPPKKAQLVLKEKIKHFNLKRLFDETIATPAKGPNISKGKFIIKILSKRKIPKSKALMIGDSYSWDYRPTRDVGVDALLLESDYLKKNSIGKRVRKTIKRLSDILKYV